MANHHWTGQGIELDWDPERSLLRMHFMKRVPMGSKENALAFVAQLEAWTGGISPPCGILVDCEMVENVDPGWRVTVNEHFRESASRFAIGWYNASPMVTFLLKMFLLGSPEINGKVCRSEADARAFLAEQGIS